MRYRFLRFPEGKPKAVTFSYDDGVRHDIRHSETLNKYGLKCTYNINSAMFGKDETSSRLTAQEVKSHLYDEGHEIALHGAKHIAPGRASAIVGIKDSLDCRLTLEKEYDMIIRGMAYPDSGINRFSNGADKDNVKRYLKDLGIVYSRTTKENNSFELPTDFLEWDSTVHHDNPEIFNLIDKFLSLNFSDNSIYISGYSPKLFYIWGHSYEFNKNNNWEHLEQICEKLSNKDDTWYATNIEIYEYVEAYNSLVFSADETIVYNPTLKKLWFTIDRELYSIDPGQTIKITE